MRAGRAPAGHALEAVIATGTEAGRIYVEGKGEKEPVADNATADGRARNRRLQIEVVSSRMR